MKNASNRQPAAANRRIETKNAVYADGINSVTITIKGKAFATLKKIAAVFSKWDEEPNTPAEIACRFMIGDAVDSIMNRRPGEQSFAGLLVDKYVDFPDHVKLASMFKSAGVPVVM